MQFQTSAQEACYHKVALWMQELFGKFPCARQDIPGLGLFMGSALVEVLILPWGEEDAVINTRAYVVTEAELSSDLMRFLLEQNSNMIFGAFGIDAKGDIVFEHSIVGSTCDKKELESSVNAVLEVSDEYDDQLVERWGGKRALDRICGNPE
ncbi:YbjN domain-containing protein [Laspinema olomoucense]|uniref:YbjN domain-containing protein n=1 Tax=Laspinema olomoucense D3b TaxID=2953688 RepID=A0ABT2N6U3_9CYAN|nr:MULTISPECIES: YbjN domain-containing protein [unclassified Laspinema]MCT7972278.1 YbjN domain-containing protein [Laspinema sp. D3d]MCT7978414.1 YbjN domain-containing protein [Laspinema sp. D3b]